MKYTGLIRLFKILILIGCLTVSDFKAFSQERQINVVPYPQEVIFHSGKFNPAGRIVGIQFSGINPETGKILLDQLSNEIKNQYNTSTDTNLQKNKYQIYIGVVTDNPSFLEFCTKQDIIPDSTIGIEGYLLRISKDLIIVSANNQAGAFYGAQTLKQMIRGDKPKEGIPCVLVKDWPALSIRAVMDDISRGPVPNMNFMKTQIKRYAELKINCMSFYIEHIVKTKKYPDLAPYNGGISIEDFTELSEYAKDYQMKLIGNFQSLGHFEKILSLPQYRHLGATERMLDPLNPESLAFLKDIYTEMAPAFSSEYFTPDCDEAWDLSRGKLAGADSSLSPSEIYANHVMGIHEILSGLGKKTFIWGDIILEHPGILDTLPNDIIIAAWNYGALESFSAFIDPVKDAGFDFFVSPGIVNSGRIIPDFRMTFTNIRNFINEGYKKGALGVYCTVWDDGGTHAFSRDWYGVAYNAEQSWRPNNDETEKFDKRFSMGIYGDDSNSIPEALQELNKLTDLGPSFEMNMNIFFKELIPERGEMLKFNLNDWKEILEITKESDEILSESNASIYTTDLDFIKFSIDQYIFIARSREQILTAAGNYNSACESQLTDPELSLTKLKTAMKELLMLKQNCDNLVLEFERLWKIENKNYWLDRALLRYKNRQTSINDAIHLLSNATEVFKNGNFLPPPNDVRLDIRQMKGRYFQFWLVCGSFPISDFSDSSMDFLKEIGGEANTRPYPGMKFTASNGKEYYWAKYDSPSMTELDFKKIFEPSVTAVAYAYCTIYSPDKRTVSALLGSNDGAKVFCNGEEIFHFHGKRDLIPDENLIKLNLNKGANHIMIRVEQWKAGWGLSFRLKDQEIRNHKQKYYIQ